MRARRHLKRVLDRANPLERVKRTEAEEARRKARAFLRDRTDDDVPEWDDEEGKECANYDDQALRHVRISER